MFPVFSGRREQFIQGDENHTPAENPSETESNLVLVFLVKNAKALPMPVDKPANRVKAKAVTILVVSKLFF